MSTKQVIVIRTDLNLRKGKMCSSAAHASVMFLLRRLSLDRGVTHLTPVQERWLNQDRQRIAVVRGEDAQHLITLFFEAKALGVEAHLFHDAGFTEVKPDTLTALAIGPDEDAKIDAIARKLRLL